MKRIDSKANPQFREWLKDKSRAGRRGSMVWLEGPHLCQSWLENGHHVRWLIVDEGHLLDPQVQSLLETVDPRFHIILGRGLFEALSDVGTPQGVLMLGELPCFELPDTLESTVVVLDGVQDPGNVGSILRTCAATGVHTVFTSSQTAACWSPKVLRSAQGAHAGLKIYEGGDVAAWLKRYSQQSSRLPILVTTLQDADDLYQRPLPAEAIWIFGSEGQGVSAQLQALADRGIKIDHSQQYVESLNVGIAAALCLFEQRRQRHVSSSLSSPDVGIH